MKRKQILYGAMAAALWVSAACGQMHGAGGQATQQMGAREEPKNEMVNGPGADRAFLKKAMESNMAEIQMAQLAQQTSTDDQVKQLAQQLQEIHGKMQDELKQAAAQLSVPVPDKLSKNAAKKMEKMKSLSGDAFDQAYLKEAMKSHKDADAAFKEEANTTTSPQLKELVTADSQMVKEHIQLIQKIADSKGKS